MSPMAEMQPDPPPATPEPEHLDGSDSSAPVRKTRKGIANKKTLLIVLNENINADAPYWRHMRKMEKQFLELAITTTGSLHNAAAALGVTRGFMRARTRALDVRPKDLTNKGREFRRKK